MWQSYLVNLTHSFFRVPKILEILENPGRIKLKHIMLLAKLLPDNELISRQHTETLNTYDL